MRSSDGGVTSWAAWATGGGVTALTLTPDKTKVIAGGDFTAMWNDTTAYGMAALDATTGYLLPWQATQTIKNGGDKGGISSLMTYGNQIIGTGWSFTRASANFEGIFSANPDTGAINFLNDCHGDSYSTYPLNGALYLASHVHSCEWIGAFKNTTPTWTRHYATAFTIAPDNVNTGPDDYGWNYSGIPASTVLHWYPDMTAGTYTGQGQAGWSVTGTADYVAYGGEFTSVNNVAQQGLTRFARTGIAPNKRGPRVSGGAITPVVTSPAPGTARITWQTTWDTDNATLRYELYRDNGATPIYSVTQDSNFWNQPNLGFRDEGLENGSQHTYKIRVVDPFGNNTTTANVPVTIAAADTSPYRATVVGDGASALWRLGQASGTTSPDSVGFADLTLNAGVTSAASGAIDGDADTASGFGGTSTGFATTRTAVPGPAQFSVEAWIKTTTTAGGKIVGFGNSATGNSGTNDRHLYMLNNGRLAFGVMNGTRYTAISTKSYNDGTFHHVVGALGSNGMVLYVDGKKVATNSATTSSAAYNGFWRVGGDNLTSWASKPTSNYINGTIDDVAVYPTALTFEQVRKHVTDSGRSVVLPIAPTDDYGRAVSAAQPDIFWRLDESAGSTAKDSSVNEQDGTLTGGVTLGQASNVSGATGTAMKFNGSNGTVGSVANLFGPSTYTESAWFKTTTTTGGKIIGFGSSATGASASNDRHVYMETSGKLTFGTYTGVRNLATSTKSYNDGKWHQVVATQSSEGMKLYVDGAMVATNAQTAAQSYTGFWRVGGDTSWAGSNYFNGTIDEVAIWNSAALTQAQVEAIFFASPAAPNNQLPTAAFPAPACTWLDCAFSAASSSDPDGAIASYSWSFGDAGTASGATPEHTYNAEGSYDVTLTVTDNRGGTSSATRSVTVTRKPNELPTASLDTASCTFLKCAFDGSSSSDTDGTITSYSWSFGDGTDGTGATPSHTFADGGTYTVALTVTDDRGGSASVTQVVTVAPKPNDAPVASIGTPTCSYLTCSFDGSGSTDDGSVAGYSWSFGDGSGASSQEKPIYTFSAPGSYSVTLTVVDNLGVASSTTTTVVPKSNVPPTAVISTPTCTSLACMFSSSGSTDPEAPIASYEWDFGDGSAVSTQANPAYSFAMPGTYTVRLTVTDEVGAKSTVNRAVTVSLPAVLANDTFTRSVTNGWGAGEIGGSWVVTGGAANFKVGSGLGTMTLAAAGASATAVVPVLTPSADVLVTETTNKAISGGGVILGVTGRKVAGAGEYRGKVRATTTGAVYISIARLAANGAETIIKSETLVSGLTYVAGTPIKIRFQAEGIGTTSLRLKVWNAGDTELACVLGYDDDGHHRGHAGPGHHGRDRLPVRFGDQRACGRHSGFVHHGSRRLIQRSRLRGRAGTARSIQVGCVESRAVALPTTCRCPLA
ncbi:MAG: PKD domain-containing protein [Candidatus Nanopelagicales bacterium]